MESDRRLKKVCLQCDTTVHAVCGGTTHVTHSPTHMRGSAPPRVLLFIVTCNGSHYRKRSCLVFCLVIEYY